MKIPLKKTNMTHDEFPFHGFANHYQKKSRHDLPLFSAKKSSFHPVVDRVFFFTQINRDSRNTPVKLDNIQRPTSRRGRLQGGFKICHHTLWTHSCFGTTPPGWSQSSLVSPPKSVEDSMALVFGLLGIPPPKKTSYCWMLQKSGYVNTWQGAKKSYWKWWEFSCQFLNWFFSPDFWAMSRKTTGFWRGPGMQSCTLFCCPRFVGCFFLVFFFGGFLVVH